MKIVCISDTHNRHKEIDVGSGDILIHAGDATGRGYLKEVRKFMEWYAAQDFAYKIFIAGNHDWGWEGTKMGEEVKQKLEKEAKELGLIYLNDSGVTIKHLDTGKDIKIWGSPVQPEFCNWAFNRSVSPLAPKDPYHHPHGIHPWIKPHWDKIPDDTDIIITHGPPEGIRDQVLTMQARYSGMSEYENVGCPHLMDAIKNRIKPKMHVFGHIHEEYGVSMFVNASSLDDRYIYSHKPVEIIWEDGPKHK
jgi:predicted phosphodiesterase